jgi:hypothetical protein
MSGQSSDYNPEATLDADYIFGTAEYSERMIKPTANVGFFGWLALLGIPLLMLFLIYTKSTQPGLVNATSAQKLQASDSAVQEPVESRP